MGTELERVDRRKIRRAQELLGFDSEVEAIEVALDLLILDDAYFHRPDASDPAARTNSTPIGGGTD